MIQDIVGQVQQTGLTCRVIRHQPQQRGVGGDRIHCGRESFVPPGTPVGGRLVEIAFGGRIAIPQMGVQVPQSRFQPGQVGTGAIVPVQISSSRLHHGGNPHHGVVLLKTPPIVVSPVRHIVSRHIGHKVPAVVVRVTVQKCQGMPGVVQPDFIAGQHECPHKGIRQAGLAAHGFFVLSGGISLAVQIGVKAAVHVVAPAGSKRSDAFHKIDIRFRVENVLTLRLIAVNHHKLHRHVHRRWNIGSAVGHADNRLIRSRSQIGGIGSHHELYI